MKKIFGVITLLLLASVQMARAQDVTAVRFLNIQPDARASGMGNTGVALANNSSAVYWNPAGLGNQRGNQISITHSQWLPNLGANLFYDYLTARNHVDGIGTFGGHVTYLNMGHQTHTDGQGNNLGQFSSYDLAIGISYGIALSDNWSIGTGIRFIHSHLYNGSFNNGQGSVKPVSSFGVDLAALYKTDPFKTFGSDKGTFRAGIDLSNIGPKLNFNKKDSLKDALPTELRFGWAFKTGLGNGDNSITLTNDYSKIMARPGSSVFGSLINSWGPYTRETSQGKVTLSTLQQFRIGTGLEYWYKHLFSVRTGYYYENPNNGNRKFITLGAGIRYDFIGVDISHIFSLKQNHPMANTTRFGLLLNF